MGSGLAKQLHFIQAQVTLNANIHQVIVNLVAHQARQCMQKCSTIAQVTVVTVINASEI